MTLSADINADRSVWGWTHAVDYNTDMARIHILLAMTRASAKSSGVVTFMFL
jgi:hypothetical protein